MDFAGFVFDVFCCDWELKERELKGRRHGKCCKPMGMIPREGVYYAAQRDHCLNDSIQPLPL